VARLFFLVSGEHPTLPFSEIIAILEAEEYQYKALERLRQIFRIETTEKVLEPIIARAAMTRICCRELFNCAPRFAEIAQTLRRTSLEAVIQKGDSFAVRVRRIGGVTADVVSVDLERKLGEIILKKAIGTKVKLKTPKHIFLGIITENRFVFGLKLAEIATKPFMERRPRKRPFFQPSAVAAKLARCMVNLAKVRKDDLIFDPFCGTGSFLIEAGLIGCCVIGVDAQRHMVNGALSNLRHFNVVPVAVIVADAEHPPVTGVDGIVTDPPYGRTASTLGKSTEEIVKAVLPEFQSLLDSKKRVCIASPKAIGIRRIAERAGFKHLESHYVYVHRSLTREIAVLETP
jgi:tRNA (guanine10-N2)-dimethyltransferase